MADWGQDSDRVMFHPDCDTFLINEYLSQWYIQGMAAMAHDLDATWKGMPWPPRFAA